MNSRLTDIESEVQITEHEMNDRFAKVCANIDKKYEYIRRSQQRWFAVCFTAIALSMTIIKIVM